jgi:16S rRNA (guanine1207-N2)-methyltransferase
VPPPSHPAPDGGGTRGNDQYFSGRPGSASRPSEVALVLPDVHVRLRTDAGVFSPGRVDPGTKLLLTELPESSGWPSGDVVDVGCGYGPIAVTLALRAPERTVWAVDVNERSLDLCRANADAAGVGDRVRVVTPDTVPEELRVGLVASNPPIRVGKAALHELCRTWLGRLADDGEAWWVVQKHLGSDSLQTWMAGQGWPTERVRSRQSYRILRSTRS